MAARAEIRSARAAHAGRSDLPAGEGAGPRRSLEGLRKTYVRRSDVAAYLEARTFLKDAVVA
jgi:hypothetical protein